MRDKIICIQVSLWRQTKNTSAEAEVSFKSIGLSFRSERGTKAQQQWPLLGRYG